MKNTKLHKTMRHNCNVASQLRTFTIRHVKGYDYAYVTCEQCQLTRKLIYNQKGK